MPAALTYLAIMLAVIIVWFLLLKRPVYEAVLISFIILLTITGTWNEFMLINILASSEKIKSLPVGVQKFSGALASDYGKQFAALMISIIPIIIFYGIFRKQITKGVAAGAVKG